MIYLGSLSATLVALALIAQNESTVDDFRVCALFVLPTLVFLGTVTFARIIETGIEDAIYAQASAQAASQASGNGGSATDDEVVEDADFEVIDEEETSRS